MDSLFDQGTPFIVQSCPQMPHANYELLKAKVFLEIGHVPEVCAQGDVALKRLHLEPEAWGILVTSAIYRKDRSRAL